MICGESDKCDSKNGHIGNAAIFLGKEKMSIGIRRPSLEKLVI